MATGSIFKPVRFTLVTALRLFLRRIGGLAAASVAVFTFMWRQAHSAMAVCHGCGDLPLKRMSALPTLLHQYVSWVLSVPIVVILVGTSAACVTRALVASRAGWANDLRYLHS